MRDRESVRAWARHGRVRVVAAACVVALVLIVGATPALGKEAKPKPKPDLVVATARLEGNSYTFWREREPLSVEDVTRNTGARRAGPTLTRVYIVHGHKSWLLVQRAVPALGPGKEHKDEGSSDISATRNFPIGAYTLKICADGKQQVDESDENNCRPMLPGTSS